jgi:hypothetical protein
MPENIDEAMPIQSALEGYMAALADAGIMLRVRRNFNAYSAIRRDYGDFHLNQVFDPRYAKFGDRDFWLLAENRRGEAIATHCLRRFGADDFYDLIRSQALWFGTRLHLVDRPFVVACAIPPFGGEIAHGGGLWVRPDYRGSARLAFILPRLARAIALRTAPFDHDSGMIRNDPRDPPRLADRKATFMGMRTYGFARVHRFVEGWFPPEGRSAIMHLCHATRAEAVASLVAPLPGNPTDGLGRVQLRQRPLVYQHEQLVDTPAVRGQGQQQSRI